jgi:hypothetical protein
MMQTIARVVTFAVAALLLAGASTLGAQTLRGELLDGGSGRPIDGAVVVLVGADGKRVAGVLSDAAGRFLLRAPAPGRYLVRVERIGFRRLESAPLEFAPGAELRQQFVLQTEPIALEGLAVSVRADQRCLRRVGDGHATARIWDEAQKALNAVEITREQKLTRFDVALFTREVDVRMGTVLRENVRILSSASEQPFRSVPIERLVSEGFVKVYPDSTIYLAPDAHVLLSEEFLRTHCFRAQRGSGERVGMLGLAFEPVRERRVPEVRGVLWLDEASSELRDLEYSYVNAPVPAQPEHMGGSVVFRRLPSGAWIVERWVIRMPRQVDAPPRAASALRERTPPRWAIQLARLRTMIEEGGEILAFHDGRDETRLAQRASVEGVVFDSLTATPLAGATVFLSGTGFSAVTDSAGRFRIEGLPFGRSYEVSFHHPLWKKLGLVPETRVIEPESADPVRVDLAVPGADRLLELLCSEGSIRNGRGAVFGYVWDGATGAMLADREVAIQWDEPKLRIRQVTALEGVVRSTEEGAFLICGVPVGRTLRIEARFGRESGGRHPLILEQPTLVVHDVPWVEK